MAKQQRIFKIRKNKSVFEFFTLLYTYHTDRYGVKVQTGKIESQPTKIDEETFITKVNGIKNNYQLLHPGTLWASPDNKSFLIMGEPDVKEIYIAEYGKTYDFPHPKVIYYITKNSNDKPYVAGVWFVADSKLDPQYTRITPAWILNVFRDGMVCVHNVYEDKYNGEFDYNLLINTAIEDFWSGTFNYEVNDLLKVKNLYSNNKVIDYDPSVLPLDHTQKFLLINEAYAKKFSIEELINSGYFKNLANGYYDSFNLSQLITYVQSKDPQTQLRSKQDVQTTQNNYLISDIIAFAYKSSV